MCIIYCHSSIDTVLAYGTGVNEFKSRENRVCLKFPRTKLTANCLVENHTKLDELILVAMVLTCADKDTAPFKLLACSGLRMMQTFVWCFLGHIGQQSLLCAEGVLRLQSQGGVVH